MRMRATTTAAGAALVIAAGFAGVPLPSIEKTWSIGVYAGTSPFALAPTTGVKNPVLTATDVTDAPAAFVADPFIVRSGTTWHLFCEVFNRRTRQGDIGWATSTDLLHWQYRQIVLDEPFHLSYPYVFEADGEHYLIPESSAVGQVRLYRAAAFPAVWRYAATLIDGPPLADASVARVNGRWWLFAESGGNQRLSVYFADRLIGPWQPHHHNPVAGGLDRSRPAGRIAQIDGRLIRFAQVDTPVYGRAVRAFAITALTPDVFEETPVTAGTIVDAAGRGWNARGMHQVEPVQVAPDRWLALVDGYESTWMFGMRRVSWRSLAGSAPR
jgi:hypothetical protein